MSGRGSVGWWPAVAVALGVAALPVGSGAASYVTVAAPGLMRSDTVQAVTFARIGVIDGEAEYLFGDVSALAADRFGRIYVGDRIGSSIRVYSPRGEFVAQIGREGSGPGEFSWPVDIRLAGDTVVIRDGARVTYMAPRRDRTLPDSVIRTWTLPGYGNLTSRAAALVGTAYYYPAYRFGLDGTTAHHYIVMRNGSPTRDTLRLPAYSTLAATREASYRVGQNSGRMVYGLNRVPFGPMPHWDILPDGLLVSGQGDRYELYITNLRGDTVARLGRNARAQRIDAGERRDSARALRTRIDSLPVPMASMMGVPNDVKQQRLPDVLPAFIGVVVARDGRIWVRRWPRPRRNESIYDVFERGGKLLATVVVPFDIGGRAPPFITSDAIYAVSIDPATDVARVVAARFRIP